MSTTPPLCLPPLPLRRADGRLLPPGTCDTHMHVFGPEARYPLSSVRGYTPCPVTLDDYAAVMTAVGIDRAVLVQPSVYGTDNAALLDALGRMPDRLRGVAVIDPQMPDEDLHALHAAGVRGVRVNRRNPGGLALDAVAGLAARIAPFGWHIQLQVELARGVELDSIARDCPVPLVLDHFGFLDPAWGVDDGRFAGVLRLMESGTLWVKMSAPYRLSHLGPPYADVRPFAHALLACRPDRVLWATDWPHTELWRGVPDELDLVSATAGWLTDAQRQSVLVDNPARLYGFPAIG